MFEVLAGRDCRLLSRPRSILGVAWPRCFKAWFHGCPNTADGAWSFDSFTAGATALRSLEQEGVRGDMPHMCRLSDPDETAAIFKLGGWKTGALGNYLLLRAAGGVPLGPLPATAWEHGRFSGPYLHCGNSLGFHGVGPAWEKRSQRRRRCIGLQHHER